MSTVALIEPRSMPRRPARSRRRRSRAGPRGGSRAWAGRSRGRCRGRARRGRCGRTRGRSRRGSPTSGAPSISTCFSGRCHPRGRITSVAIVVVEPVVLAARANRAPICGGTASRTLSWPCDDVVPRRRVRVLEVGHEDAGARVQGVDHHLALDRAGDLDAPVLEVLPAARRPPVAGADCRGLGEEVGELAGVEAGLAGPARPRAARRRGAETAFELDRGRRRRRR